jgi:hypothetical protein
MKGGVNMNIGDRIIAHNETQIDTITNIVPVQYKDDGNMQWYEVCDATKTDYIAIVGKCKTIEGKEIDVICVIKKSENIDLLLDLL